MRICSKRGIGLSNPMIEITTDDFWILLIDLKLFIDERLNLLLRWSAITLIPVLSKMIELSHSLNRGLSNPMIENHG